MFHGNSGGTADFIRPEVLRLQGDFLFSVLKVKLKLKEK